MRFSLTGKDTIIPQLDLVDGLRDDAVVAGDFSHRARVDSDGEMLFASELLMRKHPAVHHLLGAGSPAPIAGFVAPGVVDPVEGHAFRNVADIRQKI